MRIAAVILGALLLLTGAGAAAPPPAFEWQAVWTTATQRPGDSFNWSTSGFGNQSVRQVIRVSAGGSTLRLRLSNRFGDRPLVVTGGTIARSAGGAALYPESLQPLTIGREFTFRIDAGAEAVTDPVALPVAALEALTVTLYFAEATGPATYHALTPNTAYLAWDDHRADGPGDAFAVTSTSYYYLDAVEVADSHPHRPAVALFGDSFTEGVGSTRDEHNAYPDQLAELLLAQDRRRAVLNLGINGNCVIADSQWLGEGGLTRFQRDVIARPGVGTVVILQGINDIWVGGANLALGPLTGGLSAEEVIEGLRGLIAQARAAGLRVIGATIAPVGRSTFDSGDRARFREREGVRRAVNDWIRDSGEYDAVADIATVLADPAATDRLAAVYDIGDHLHPNDAGHAAMAAAVAAVLD
ncbi:GDSL-type esterase/lipase family protein [Nocardia sp. NPDC055321]